MEDLVTTDTILGYLKDAVEQKIPISPHLWVDASAKLNTFLSDEDYKFHTFQQIVAKLKLEFLKESKSVAEAKLKTEATDEYKAMRLQEARIKRIEEQIRIAKIQARLTDNDFKLK